MKKILLFIILVFIVSIWSCSNTEMSSQKTEEVREEMVREEMVREEMVREEMVREEIEMAGEEISDEKMIEMVEMSVEIIEMTVEIINELEIEPMYLIYENDYYGDINYVLEDTMIVDKITVVNMTISNDVQLGRIISDIETFTDDNIYSETIRIAPIMSAKLLDPIGTNFIVTPITSEQQFLEEDEYTLWIWDVTPLKKGNHKLSLTVNVVFDDNTKTVEVYEDFIYVYSDKTVWNNITSFFIENWKWGLSSLIIPILIFFYKKRKRTCRKPIGSP